MIFKWKLLGISTKKYHVAEFSGSVAVLVFLSGCWRAKADIIKEACSDVGQATIVRSSAVNPPAVKVCANWPKVAATLFYKWNEISIDYFLAVRRNCYMFNK